jgi:phosphatidate cytidylyltransferase
MKNLITRSITGILFVAVIVTCFLKPTAMALLFSLVAGMTIWEFCGLVNARNNIQVNRLISTVAGVYLVLAVTGFSSGLTPSSVFIPYLLSIIYLMVAELYLKQPDPISDWAYTMLSQMYIALPLSCISVLAFTGQADGTVAFSPLLPLSVFVFLWMSDSGAYCVGSLLGRNKLFPRISPGKSWEGSIGGSIVALLTAAFIWHAGPGLAASLGFVSPALSLPEWLGLALVVVVFGTWGDLVESLFKRTLGIKDSGNILPGHGGMLDRFDSSLMAIPAAVVYLYTLTLL